MREIRFRAWDKKHNGMFRHLVSICFDHFPLQIQVMSSLGDMEIHHISNVELMQYTGLRDKNGVEIYEGDIALNYALERYHSPKNPLRFVVIFKDGSFQFESCKRANGDPDYARKCSHKYNPFEMIKPDNWEIIGNIYENPELLNKDSRHD